MDFIIYKLIVIAAVFGMTMTIAMYATLAERKFSAFLQDRIGPNRAGPFGLLQPLADGIKFFFKEEFTPSSADKWLFIIAPGIAMTTALMVGAVIPWGDTITINGTPYLLQITDLDIGVLYVFGVVSLSVYGIMIGGWASNNKYSLLGALRASSQIISYELGMGLSLIGLLLISETLSLRGIVVQQGQPLVIPFTGISIDGLHWNVFFQPLGFIIFTVCAFAETNRAPFDLPECEAELVAGYHTEYSSMKLGLFLFAEYIHMFTSSAMMAVLFFGGFNFPFMNSLGLDANVVTILGHLAMMGKTLFFMFVFIWVRWTLPRFRYDQLMKLGWQILIPLALANIFVTALIILITG
ncbi:MAG: NADH-quinone oxidoreductase subunit NuoH [Chitinophagales bacterium]|nr:NADH-quinone oxidoreductase subunit NuoH [Chitinophagales bacterium]